MKYSVYKLTFPNNKVYIGMTSREPKKRWNYGFGYKKNKNMFSDILKYGWKNIKKEIIEEYESKEVAYQKEIDLIKEYQSINDKYGYNKSTGGIASKKGTKMSDSNKKMLLQRLKGNKYHLNKLHSETTKQKLSLIQKGQHRSVKTEFPKKQVICIETQNIYFSIAAAERDTGIGHSHISQVCQNKRHKAGGYHWKYYEG